MKIRVETVWSSNYEHINEMYGNILRDYNFSKEGRFAFVTISSIEEIEKLNFVLEKYVANYDGDDLRLKSSTYHGLRFQHCEDEFILLIQDDYE